MRSVAVLGACAVLTLTACASSSSSGPSAGGDLTGVTWVLDAASMTTLSHGAPAGARVDLVFDGSQASGRAACNSYFGGYQADAQDGTLSFANLGATMMACDQALMDLESAYLAALGDVTDYQVSGEQRGLVLTGGDVALTFRAEQPAAPLPLENTTWTLTTVASPGTQAVSSTVAGTEVTMTLDGGTANGSGGCNTYHVVLRDLRPVAQLRSGRIDQEDVRATGRGPGARVLLRARGDGLLRGGGRSAHPARRRRAAPARLHGQGIGIRAVDWQFTAGWCMLRIGNGRLPESTSTKGVLVCRR